MNNTPRIPTILDLEPDELSPMDGTAPQAFSLVSLFLMEQKTPAHTAGEIMRLSDGQLDPRLPPPVRVLVQTLQKYAPGVPLGPVLLGTVGGRCKAPHHPVLWAHCMAAFWERHHTPVLAGALLMEKLDGALPTAQAMDRLWVAQKTPAGDNWLDSSAGWMPAVLAPPPRDQPVVAPDLW